MKKVEEVKRNRMISIIIKVLEANIELMDYYKHFASDDKSRKVCSKSIKQSKKAIEKIKNVKHIEILVSIFNAIISGKESIFVLGGSLICSPQFDKWDKSEKGFQEFLEIEKSNKEEQRKKMEEQQLQQEALKKAKEEGKKIEMVYENGKLKPVIQENNGN